MHVIQVNHQHIVCLRETKFDKLNIEGKENKEKENDVEGKSFV